MSTLGIPTDIEASEINSDLNTSMLLTFLLGIYTVIYFETIYVYYAKHSSKHHLIPAAITMLYLSSVFGTGCQWYDTKRQFVDNGATRQSIFLAVFENPRWVLISINASNCVVFVIADGLLIWRCFYVWNRSLRIISLSLFLIIAEIALFLVEISFNARYTNVSVSPALAARIDAVLSAALFMSFGTTLVTTILIAYRVYSFSKEQGSSSKRFKRIIDIVIQSGAVYALSQLTAALAGVVPGSNTLSMRNVAFDDYGQLLNFAIPGISATVMVARVALLSADNTYPSTSVHVSGLQFYSQSTHRTDVSDVVEIAHSVDGVIISSGEEQHVEGKVQ